MVCAGVTLTATGAEETNKVAELQERPDYWNWTVGIEGGTEGIGGLFGRWRFSDHVGLHLATDYTTWSLSHVSIANIHYDATIRLLNEPLTFDIFPWKKHSFYISFGWLFNQNQLTGSASDQGTIIIDGHPFPTDQVGSLDLKIRQQWVNPYASIGGNFLYFDHAHHWALGGELGAAFTGDPQVTLTRSGPPAPLIDAAVQGAQRRAQDYANQFKWWPVVKIQLSYSF
jgi:hypothetical protein